MYPGTVCGTYDGWSNVGGVHLEANLGGGNLGAITMPVDGQGGAFARRSRRSLRRPRRSAPDASSSTRSRSRPAIPDPPAPLQWNGRVEYGAFASTASRGAVWSGGVGWAGRYLLFVTDTATGRKITGQRRHRSELDPDDRPRRRLFRLRQLRLQRRRARRHCRVVPSHGADSHPRHAQGVRVLESRAVGGRTELVAGPDPATALERQP